MCLPACIDIGVCMCVCVCVCVCGYLSPTNFEDITQTKGILIMLLPRDKTTM